MADEKHNNNNDIHVKKRSKAENIMTNFVTDLIVNVFLPAIERTMGNIVSDTFDVTKRTILSAMKFDGTTSSSSKPINGNPTRISYNDYYNRFNNGGPGTFTPVINDYAYNEITFDTRPKAELILAKLKNVLRMEKVVTVGHYYSFCEIPTSPTDFEFGWINLDNVQTEPYRGRYRIKLPKAMPIDR